MNIQRGIKKSPIRAVLYGVEGIGKSSLGQLLPAPLFIDVEKGTEQLDVARVLPNSWAELMAAFRSLWTNPQGFKTIVVDTADWAERLCNLHVCEQARKDSIEDFGYGKGYVAACEEFARILQASDALISKGLNVVWLAHSKVTRTSPPDQTDGYDRYELKLSKHIAPLLKEWADLILFATTEVQVVQGSDGKLKAQGGKARVIHTERTAAWDAKNRFSLPERLPMEKGVLAPELRRIFVDQTAPTVPKDDEIPGLAGDDSAPAPAPAPVVSAPKQEPAPAAPAPASVGTLADAELQATFSGQEAKVHSYLVGKKWLGAEEPLSALAADRVAQIKAHLAPFARAAGLTLNNAATV